MSDAVGGADHCPRCGFDQVSEVTPESGVQGERWHRCEYCLRLFAVRRSVPVPEPAPFPPRMDPWSAFWRSEP